MSDDEDARVQSFFYISSSSPSPGLSDVEAAEVESQAREVISRYKPQAPKDKTAQVLRSFVDYLPPDGRQKIIPFIANCGDDKVLHSLSEHLCSAILFPMKARSPKEITPSPLEGADDRVDEIGSDLVESSSRNPQSALKKQCFKRDGYRCMVTGIFDNAHAFENVPTDVFDPSRIGLTELAHILPFTIGNYSNKQDELRISRIWEALYTCFPAIRDRTNLKADAINDATNLMTLLINLHDDFGKLSFALEPTGEENSYRVQTYSRFSSILLGFLPSPNENNERIVRFEKHSHGDGELPDPVLLETHAIVAKILHASGMAEVVEDLGRELEATRCLAPDGTTNLHGLLSLRVF